MVLKIGTFNNHIVKVDDFSNNLSQLLKDERVPTELSLPGKLFTRSIKRVLKSHRQINKVSIGELSACFNMSKRTVNRKLLTEESRFLAIKQPAIFLKAVILLFDTSLKIYEIAEDLGYNESANFIRFFRKFTGTTPEKYRKLNKYEAMNACMDYSMKYQNTKSLVSNNV